MFLLVTTGFFPMCFETLRQVGLRWFYRNYTGSETILIIVTVVVIVA